MTQHPDVWTIGHSTRPIDRFLSLLRGSGIRLLADVRRFPGSRRHPQFGREALERSLAAEGIRYEHVPELGGRRRPRPGSANTVWRHEAFRGYADYMETPEFAEALARIVEWAKAGPTALMCSEALWWQCHRGLIADALKARGFRVLHIADGAEPAEHPYTSAARIVEGRLVYGARPGTLEEHWDPPGR